MCYVAKSTNDEGYAFVDQGLAREKAGTWPRKRIAFGVSAPRCQQAIMLDDSNPKRVKNRGEARKKSLLPALIDMYTAEEAMKEESHLMFKEDFGLLIEAGFIAVKQLDETSASRIFHAAQVISPQSMAPRIGLGYIALNKLELKEASKIFQEVLAKEPENMLAQVFLGITYLLLKPKRDQGEELIREALTKASDPTIIHLAELSLEWADKDIKTGKLRIPYDDGSKKAKQANSASAAPKNTTP